MMITGPKICEVGKCHHGCTMETGGCKGTEFRLNHAQNYLRAGAAELIADGERWGFTVTVHITPAAQEDAHPSTGGMPAQQVQR